MEIQQNYSLKHHNTFRVDVNARYFAEASSIADITKAFESVPTNDHHILGDGSNTLFTHDLDGLVLKYIKEGITVIEETKEYVILEVQGGHDWHALVTWSVEQGYGGIENLALIPGTVGASPVQNIAAYGQNLADTFLSLTALHLQSGTIKEFSRDECQFGYRDSIFKQTLKGQYLITSIRIKLSKQPDLETSYFEKQRNRESIMQELEQYATAPYSVKDVYNAVINIRTRKLPSVEETPTVGSFFVNPTISREKLAELQAVIPDLQYYPVEQLTYSNNPSDESEFVKIAAARLIDELGWRGKKVGNCWMYEKHALIPVHNGMATGEEIHRFTTMIKTDVFNHYGVELHSEVNII